MVDFQKALDDDKPATVGDVRRIVAESEARIVAAIQASQMSARQVTVSPPNPSGGLTLPNYGRKRGEPISGCPISDLEYYANGCRRTLDDPAKSRWHEKERALLAAIQAEIARQNGGSAPAGGGGDFGGGTGDDDGIPFSPMSARIQ